MENEPAGSIVGTLSTIDPSGADAHTYSLVSGPGSTDNAKFQVAGSQLQTSEPLDFETGPSLTVRLQTDDGHGGTFQKEFSIAVSNANEAPTDVSLTSSSVVENQSSGTLVGTLSATDQDTGDTQTFSVVPGTGSTDNGSFTITGSSLETNAVFDFETRSSYSIRVRATDAGALTFEKVFTISVTSVNEAPVVHAAAFALAEGTGSGGVIGAVTFDDQDAGQTHAFAITAGNTGGAFAIDGASGVITVAASSALDYETTPTFALTVAVTDDGTPVRSGSATVTVEVTNVNEAPVNTVPPGAIAAQLNTDTDVVGIAVFDPDVGSDDLGLTFAVADGTVTVATGVPGGVGPGDVIGNGTASATLTAGQAELNATLAAPDGLVYRSDAIVSGPSDTLTVTTNDLGHNGSGGPKSDVDTIAIAISLNAPPVPAAQSVSTGEDTHKTITLAGTDADGDTLTFSVASGPAHGSLDTTTPSASCNAQTPNACTAAIVYSPVADYTGPDSLTFTVHDGKIGSNAATVSITVDAENDAPVVTATAGSLAYTENDPATALDAGLRVSDVDSALAGATVAISVNYELGQDVLAFTEQNGITGTFVAATGTLTLSGSASPADYQTALRSVRYENTSDAPATATRTVTLTVNDGALTQSGTRGVNVTAVNDRPTLAGIESTALAYVESKNPTPPPEDQVTSALTVSDLDHAGLAGATVRLSGNYVDDQDVLTYAAPIGNPITGSFDATTGTLTLTGPGSLAQMQAALRAVKYKNTSDAPNTALVRTLGFEVSDGVAASDARARALTVAATNDPPVADDEIFSGAGGAIGNTTLIVDDPDDGAPTLSHAKKTISGDILAGDADPDHAAASLAVTPGTFATNDGGGVTIEADGDFAFTPAPSTSCTDTSDFFDYTVSDSDAPGGEIDTGRVTIAIAGCVWYVSNNAAGNDGTSAAPFDTLAQAEAVSGSNHTVFVLDGDNTSSGYGGDGYALNAGERLIGEHEGLQVDPDQGGALGTESLHSANAGAHPTITATNADVVSLDDGNEIRGLNIDPEGTGGGIAGGSDDTGGGTIDDVNIIDNGTGGIQPGLELDSTLGTFSVSNLVVDNEATGVRLHNTAVPTNAVNAVFAPAGQISIASNGGPGLDIDGTGSARVALGTSTFDDILVTGSSSGGVSIRNATGTTSLGDGTGADLSIATSSGTTPAFDLFSAGGVTVGDAGTDDVAATGGPAINATNTSGATLSFDSVSSTNSANDGINLGALGTGTFSARSGTIAGAAGIAFDLAGGSGAMSYAGALSNGTGQAARINARSGGAVILSGAIADTNDAGGGISLTGNIAGSTTFSNASKVIDTTGGGDAIVMGTSDGHTLTFSGGGLDIDTTSGKGLEATASGTLVVTGPGNTVDSTSATALNVTNTDIGAGGATFQRISSGNDTAAADPANGIVLNNTGANAGLTVTGSGGACAASGDNCSGGTIRSTTGDALSLTATRAVSLARVRIINSLGNGIRGSGVTGFTLADSVVDNNADDGATDEAGLHFTDLAGTAAITRALVSNHLEDNARIVNSSAALTQLDVTDSTFRDSDAGAAGSGLLLQADGGRITADVLGSTFLRNRGNGLQVTTNGSGVVDVEVDDSVGVQSTFDDNHIGVNVSHNSSGALDFDVRDLAIDGLPVIAPAQGASASPISLNLGACATSTMTGTVSGNTLTNSNSATGPGIRVAGNGPVHPACGGPAATMTVLLDANNISQVANHGIEVLAGDGSNRINATIANNTVNLDHPLAADAIRIDSGAIDTDTTTICADVTGNTAATSVLGHNGIRLRQRFAGTSFMLEDYDGSPTDDAAVAAFLNARNTSTPAAAADHHQNPPPAGPGFTTIAECPLPG